MKPVTVISTCLAIIAGFVALTMECDSIMGALFFAPFSLAPLLVTFALSYRCKSVISQILLLISTIGYSFWFGYIFGSAFHWHADAQSAIAMLFVGVYSMPVMLIVWGFAFLARKAKPAAEGSIEI